MVDQSRAFLVPPVQAPGSRVLNLTHVVFDALDVVRETRQESCRVRSGALAHVAVVGSRAALLTAFRRMICNAIYPLAATDVWVELSFAVTEDAEAGAGAGRPYAEFGVRADGDPIPASVVHALRDGRPLTARQEFDFAFDMLRKTATDHQGALLVQSSERGGGTHVRMLIPTVGPTVVQAVALPRPRL